MIFSRKAKEFVRALLHVDPVKRVSAGEALGLPWMRLAEQRETEALPANFAQEQTSVLRRIADFQSYGVVKRAALTFIAHRMHAGLLYYFSHSSSYVRVWKLPYGLYRVLSE